MVTVELWRDARMSTATVTLAERRRCGLDISHMIDLEELPRIELEDLHIDFEHLPHLGHFVELHEFDAEDMEEAVERMREALSRQDWEGHLERLRDVDLSDIEERLHEAMERLQELEVEIEKERAETAGDGSQIY